MRSQQTTIRARVPLRLGLAGGGTDLSPYCDQHGGAVLNTTIDRYAYAFIEPSDDGRVHFVAPDLEIEESFAPDLEAMSLGQARAARRRHAADADPVRRRGDQPNARHLLCRCAARIRLWGRHRPWSWRWWRRSAALLAAPLGPYDVAHTAFEIERIDLGLAGGKQDQYAATFGGTNFIEFHAGDRVIVNPLRIAPAILNELETSMVICFTGVSRRSEAIIVEQQRGMTEQTGDTQAGDVIDSLHQLKRDAVEMKQALLRGEIPRMAEILNRSWQAKKRTASGISTGRIETLYELAFANGAIGGKVSGAGGGGFMMFIVPPHRRIAVVRALNEAGGTASGVHLTRIVPSPGRLNISAERVFEYADR